VERCCSFGRLESATEVLVCDLQIVLAGHVLAVADPRTNNVGRESLGQLSLPRATQILPQLRPEGKSRPLNDPAEVRPLAVGTTTTGNREFRTIGRQLLSVLKVRPQHVKDWNHAARLALTTARLLGAISQSDIGTQPLARAERDQRSLHKACTRISLVLMWCRIWIKDSVRSSLKRRRAAFRTEIEGRRLQVACCFRAEKGPRRSRIAIILIWQMIHVPLEWMLTLRRDRVPFRKVGRWALRLIRNRVGSRQPLAALGKFFSHLDVYVLRDGIEEQAHNGN